MMGQGMLCFVWVANAGDVGESTVSFCANQGKMWLYNLLKCPLVFRKGSLSFAVCGSQEATGCYSRTLTLFCRAMSLLCCFVVSSILI